MSDHKLEFHFLTLATIHEAHSDMAKSGTHHQDISEKHFKQIFEGIEDILLVKDTKLLVDNMIHESNINNGFCYRRWSKELHAMEFLGYAGYQGAWTDNPSYFERKMMSNTQFHRQAQVLKSVCWFHINSRIDQVKVNHKNPIYDFYVYHAANNSRVGLSCELKLTISLDGKTKEFVQKGFPFKWMKTEMEMSHGLVRHHLQRIDLKKNFNIKKDSHFEVRCDFRDVESGWKSNYALEGISVVNAKSEKPVHHSDVTLQKKDKIIDTGILLASKIPEGKEFRIKSL